MKTTEWQQRCARLKSLKSLTKPERLEAKVLDHRAKKLEHRKKYGRLLKPSTISALSASKIKSKIRGRKPGRHGLNRLHRKRLSSSKEQAEQLNNLSNDGADEEVESIGNNANLGTRSSDSPSSSPLLHMQTISGYNKRNRVQSYDIDNIVIPYSVAASTRVEKLQYKEILTPKWRIAEQDYDSLFDKANPVRDPSQDSDGEDLSEESVVARHDRCEHEEKKRFLSYLKLPMGHGRQRSHKRTDSRAESSGANTPDPMSPHSTTPTTGQPLPSGTGAEPPDAGAASVGGSPIVSPPATPQSLQLDDSGPLPSIAVLRRRTMSACRWGQTSKDDIEAPEGGTSVAAAVEEVAPYDRRTFPISEDVYEQIIKSTPENHQLQTNTSAQDSNDYDTYSSYLAAGSSRKDSGGTIGTGAGDGDSVVDSESTESAVGDCEEDPNDPEWIDMERANRDRYKR
nr:unnamed protein product [Callosobruchus analis]